MDASLKQLAETENVDNVVLYISDSLRFDALPSIISELGLRVKTIAASTKTAASLPSITSGKYPTNHNIWSIQNDKFENRPQLLQFTNVGFDSSTSWTDREPQNKPNLNVHRMNTETHIEELSQPYVHIVHDIGAHRPYDRSFLKESTESMKYGGFYRKYGDNVQKINQMYSSRAYESAERFIEIYDWVVENGDIENTLLIFTSDHGELIGEHGGLYGESFPLVPELVSVPTVFIGAGLPTNQKSRTTISSTDIAPTLLGAQGRSIPENVDGINLWDLTPSGQKTSRSEVKITTKIPKTDTHVMSYVATGLSNDKGMSVYNLKSSFYCYGWPLIWFAFRSDASNLFRKNIRKDSIRKVLYSFKPGYVHYGNPNIDSNQFDKSIQDIKSVTP